MLDGINDSPSQAEALLTLLHGDGSAASPGLACKVNLIPFNPFAASGLKRSPAARVTTIRKTRGDDIAAACGQLAGEVQDRTRVVERRARAVPVRIAPPASRRSVGEVVAPGRRS